jgi:hypothetical protein
MTKNYLGGVRNSAVASQPCLSGHITADKREIKDFPKLPSATSFIRKPLGEIAVAVIEKYSPLYKS